MPFCLHLNMLISFFWVQYDFIPLFCLFFLNMILPNLCLTLLFLSIELLRPLTWWEELLPTELSSGSCTSACPSVPGVIGSPRTGSHRSTMLLPKQGSAVKCMINTLTYQLEKCIQRKFSHDHHKNNKFQLQVVGFFLYIFKSCAPKPENQRACNSYSALKTAPCSAKHSPVVVLLVHFRINKRPNELKTKSGEQGGGQRQKGKQQQQKRTLLPER